MRDKLLIEVARIILQHVTGHKGLKFQISKKAGINYNKFNEVSLGRIHTSTLLWIFFIHAVFDIKDFRSMLDEIADVIDEYQNEYDIELLDN